MKRNHSRLKIRNDKKNCKKKLLNLELFVKPHIVQLSGVAMTCVADV